MNRAAMMVAMMTVATETTVVVAALQKSPEQVQLHVLVGPPYMYSHLLYKRWSLSLRMSQ